jgi:hypothetical protein
MNNFKSLCQAGQMAADQLAIQLYLYMQRTDSHVVLELKMAFHRSKSRSCHGPAQ